MKVCKDCGEDKKIEEFYKGQGECKECTKLRVRNRWESRKNEDSRLLDKERLRSKNKYHRLNYRDKYHKDYYKEDKPWTLYPEYKNQSRRLSLPKGFEAHHWSYLRENICSVFIMPRKSHRKAHSFLDFMPDKRCYSFEGLLLDTKDRHEEFLKSKNLL